jgi:cyclic pyranopterin phosphate synthase
MSLSLPEVVGDRLGRVLRDLRISVTDRCNLRCTYCMPREIFGAGYRFLPREDLLTFEEIARLAGIFAALGAGKIRLTGGEPLVRRELPTLVRMLAETSGVELAMTTNGALLPALAGPLRQAGLDRLTVSLDAMDDGIFQAMNDAGLSVSRVLAGIDAAVAAGFRSIKINAVVRRGMNDGEVVALARRFRGTGHVVRFIEYMDVGETNGWQLDQVVPAAEIIERIDRVFALEPMEPGYRGEVARRYRYRDGAGEIGVISSVTQPFCGDCTRARLSAEGVLFTCLFAGSGRDLRGPLRGGASDSELASILTAAWTQRADRYSELRSAATSRSPRVEMSYIGG